MPIPVINDGLPALPSRPQQPIRYINVPGISLWNHGAPRVGVFTWSGDQDTWDNS